MSGTSAKRMREILNGTGGYRLTGESSADWELNAWGAGLDSVDRDADRLLEDLFARSASEEKLDTWEALFRPQPSAASLEERRSMLRERLAMNPARFTPGDFSPMLPTAGVLGEVKEENGGLRVLLGRLLGIAGEEAQRELEAVLPAHLPWVWDDGVHWTALDARSRSFEALDSLGLTWEEWDGLTRERLENFEREVN